MITEGMDGASNTWRASVVQNRAGIGGELEDMRSWLRNVDLTQWDIGLLVGRGHRPLAFALTVC